MECIYWCSFLLHIISTFSPLVSSRSNILKTKVYDLQSADFPRVVRSNSLNFPDKKFSFFLASADPLSTRNRITSRNVVRLGRSVNEEQPYNDDSEIDFNGGYNPVKSTKTDHDDNILCIYPKEDDADHLLCMSPQNVTSQFYAIAEPSSQDESDVTAKANQTDVYLRSVRAVEPDDYRVRKSKGGNFLRFGKAMAFNRFDRGRDNFMRFGRSDIKRKSSAENFIRFGRAFQDRYDRSLRGERLMQLSRNVYKNCDTDECLNRNMRSHNGGFMRYGRPSRVVTQQEPYGGITLTNQEGETNDMDAAWTEKEKDIKHVNSASRLDQRSRNFLQLGRLVGKECADDDEHCVEDNARFKRSLSDDCNKMKMCLNLSLPGERTHSAELTYSNSEQQEVKNESNNIKNAKKVTSQQTKNAKITPNR